MATKYAENTKYYRIEQDIKQRILDGELRPGDRVMSESEICRQYSVSRISAKRALDDLVWQGYVRRVSGSGSYVAERPKPDSAPDAANRLGLCDEIRRRGMRPSSKLVSFRALKAGEAGLPDKLAEQLLLGADDMVYHICRLRFADGEVIALDDSYIPCRRCKLSAGELEDPAVSLHRVIERRGGGTPDHAVETCHAYTLDGEQAALLELEPGTPLLRVERLSLIDGAAVGFSTRIFRDGVYEYRVDL